jgi:hypothetical protein
MQLDEIKELALRQQNIDVEDVAEYDALLTAYLSQAYIDLMGVRKRGILTGVEPLSATNNLLPEHVHSALADYATYSMLSNGNAQKQSRAGVFYSRYVSARTMLKSQAQEAAEATNGGNFTFKNF